MVFLLVGLYVLIAFVLMALVLVLEKKGYLWGDGFFRDANVDLIMAVVWPAVVFIGLPLYGIVVCFMKIFEKIIKERPKENIV